jgi:hypothetical protein
MSRCRDWGGLGLLVMVVAGAPLCAQTPAERAALTGWRDSLSQVVNRDLLRSRRDSAVRALGAGRKSGVAVMRIALLEERLAALGGIDYGAVADALRGVTEDHPDWPMAWSEYGLASLRDSRSPLNVSFALQQILGFDPVAELVAPFVTGVAADSTWTDGLVRLAGWAVSDDDDVVRQVALRALRGAGSGVVAVEPELAVWRSRIERLVGDPDSALAAIEQAARRHPDHAGILRSQAMLRFIYGRPDGLDPWYRGLARADGVVLARYRHDLAVAVPDSVLDRLGAMSGAERVATMRRVWASQDADGLPTEPERLAEQYRRVAYVWSHYLRRSLRDSLRTAHATVLWDTLSSRALDARGVIMLRHGTPEVRSSIGGSDTPDVETTLGIVGMPRNESWRYVGRDGHDLLFHFYVPDGATDFVAAESILDLLAATRQYNMFRRDSSRPPGSDSTNVVEKTYGAELVSGVAQELLRSRMGTSPLYARMLNEGKGGADSLQARERQTGRAALAAPAQYTLRFELPLDAAIDILNVGSDRRGPLVQIAFAVPGGRLSPRPVATGAAYLLRMRVAVLDSTGSLLMQVDTTRGFLTAQPLRPGEFLLGQLPLHLAAGTYRIRATLESDQRGTLSRSTTVHVVDPSRSTPTLSDLSLGARGVAILWGTPGADTAWADPRHRFARRTPMELYFEAGGMTDGTAYTVDLMIDRPRGSDGGCVARGGKLTLRFDQVATTGANRFQRAIALDRLEPGSYVLAVTVTTATGALARRCRTFEVVD